MTEKNRTAALGLIGPGRWGRNYIRTIEASPRARLAATASRDWRDLVKKPGIDGVIIATPPATHAEIAIAAIEAGLPVLVEKPLTLSIVEAREVLDHAERRSARVLVDHIHLFQPAWAELKHRAAALGPLRAVRGKAGDLGPFRDDATALWDWGPHDVALCLDLIGGMPVDVSARRLETEQTATGAGEQIALTLTFGGGVTADIEIGNLTSPKRRSFEAAYDDGMLMMDTLAADKLVFQTPGGDRNAVLVDGDLPLTVALERFVDMISRPEENNLASLRLAVDVVDVLDRCQRSLDG